jgi:heptosyltransferase-2
MSRVLLIKFGAIGDVIMLIPAAHQLHLAGHQVDWVCGPAVLPILQLYPWINPILADDRAILTGSATSRLRAIFALWTKLPREPYTLVATLYYDARYRLLALPVRAARKIRLSHTDRNLRLLPGRHHTDEFARILLNRPDQANPTPLLPVPAQNLPPSPLPLATKPRVILAPAGARNMLADDALRRWPVQNYVALTESLLSHNIEVILTGGPTDTWAQPLFAHLPVNDLIGKLSLPETLALMDSADIVITHDTGPLHLAGITRANIISIFGPTDPRGRLPQRPGTLALWGGEGFACRPCYDGHSFPACPSNDCMAQITPALVLAETLAMLQSRASGTLPAPRIATPPSTIPSTRLVTLP